MIVTSNERIRAYTDKGWWGTRTLDDYFRENAARSPEQEAVVDPPNREHFIDGKPRRLTYARLAQEVARFAALLYMQGLRKDDVLVVQLINSVEQYVVYLACLRLGIVISPVPIQYREHELGHVLAVTGARAAITSGRIGRHASAQMWRSLQAQAPALAHVMAFCNDVSEGALQLDTLLHDITNVDVDEANEYAISAGVTANDVATVCWTSGTEAKAKGVPRTHNEWLLTGDAVIDAALLQPGCRLLNPFPLVNMAGWATNVAGWLRLAGTVVQHQPFDLDVFLLQLRIERIDYTVAAPAILNQLLQNRALLNDIDFDRLRTLGSGSGPLSEWMVKGFHDSFGVHIVNYFGSNEGAGLSSSPIDIPDPVQRAQFFPRVGVNGFEWSSSIAKIVSTRLVDIESGEDIVEPGRPGELRFAGPTIFSGYFNSPELDTKAFDDHGYYKTGDLFEIRGDRNEFYRYVGRSKDLVIRGGMNISSEEIENLVMSHPDVGEVAVVGWPDDILGERVCVCVVPNAGRTITLDDVTGFLRREKQIATFKLPERILIVERLPRNPVGKILKRELRDRVRRLATDAATTAFPGPHVSHAVQRTP